MIENFITEWKMFDLLEGKQLPKGSVVRGAKNMCLEGLEYKAGGLTVDFGWVLKLVFGCFFFDIVKWSLSNHMTATIFSHT